ncbi:MAG TPA: pyridoxamine 5'-phosphate oxidase family protein [Thermomicrobiales bacterium]|nr:pyridoxamine 5'-phosphate oxidase family protein [Thermomicrobiales bacterium]
MTERGPVEVTNLDQYGHPPLPWSRARDGLAAGQAGHEIAYFLCTTRPDGHPHAAGIGALWHDDDLYFVSGPETRKSRNLAANSACTIAAHMDNLDLVLDGTASRIVDRPTLERLASAYRNVGWPVDVEGNAFTAPYTAPSGGPPPWHLYRFTLETAVGVGGEDPGGATRWRFAR